MLEAPSLPPGGLPWAPPDGLLSGTVPATELPAYHLLHEYLPWLLRNRGIAREERTLMETRGLMWMWSRLGV
eukprot:10510441-Alexandrium_andersonii.AAC.1